MSYKIAAQIRNGIVFAVSLAALIAILGYSQRKDAAYLESARQVQTEQKYAALPREVERMTSYERIGK